MRCLCFVVICMSCLACGERVDPVSMPDAAPTPDAPPPVTAGCTCLALGSGEMVGTAATVELPSLSVARDVLPGAVSSDAVLRVAEGKVFVLNRYGANNVTVVNPVGWTVEQQFSTGEGSNPQDVAVRGHTVMVALYGRPEVQVWDLTAATAPTATIDLSGEDNDGNPNAASIGIVGERAYVILGMLDDTQQYMPPKGKGKVAAINLDTLEIGEVFELAEENPFGLAERRGDDLVVATVGDFGGTAGCVEGLGLGADQRKGCLVTASEVGGWIGALTPGDDDSTYMTVAASFTEAKIVRLGPAGVLDPQQLSAASLVPTDIAICAATNQLVFSEAVGRGLHVVDLATGGEVTAEGLDVGLPTAFSDGIACLPVP